METSSTLHTVLRTRQPQGRTGRATGLTPVCNPHHFLRNSGTLLIGAHKVSSFIIGGHKKNARANEKADNCGKRIMAAGSTVIGDDHPSVCRRHADVLYARLNAAIHAASRRHQCHASSRSRLDRARRWTWSSRAARPCSAQHRVELSALRMGGLPYGSAMRHDEQRTRNTAAAAPGDVSNRVEGSAGKLSSRPGRREHNRKTACVGARYVGRKCEKTLCQIIVTIRAVTTICAAPPGCHACRSYYAREMGRRNTIDLLMGVICRVSPVSVF